MKIFEERIKAINVQIKSLEEERREMYSVLMKNGYIENTIKSDLVKIDSAIKKLFNVSINEVRAKDKRSPIVEIRQVIVYILIEKGYTYKAIGYELGGRHHSTIVHTRKRIEVDLSDRFRDDKRFSIYESIKKELE